MGIVEEIISEVKQVLAPILTDYSLLDYEYNVELNSERGLDKRYGFISGLATFAEGRALGFTTMNHTFQLILVDDYQNQDDEGALRAALFKQYELSQNALKDLQKSRLTLPTIGNRVLLISGQSYEEPETFSDNSIVVLRANFNFQYSFRNN